MTDDYIPQPGDLYARLEAGALATGEFLLPQEIKRMASAGKLDQQEAFLKKEGIPHKRLGRRILVSRAHARAWLTGVVFTPSRGINLGAVR